MGYRGNRILDKGEFSLSFLASAGVESCKIRGVVFKNRAQKVF